MSLESVNLRHKKIKNDLSDKRHDMRHHSRRQLWDQPARSTLSLPSRRECRFGSFLSLHLSRRHTHGSHESKKNSVCHKHQRVVCYRRIGCPVCGFLAYAVHQFLFYGRRYRIDPTLCIPYHGGCHHGDIFSRKNHFLDHAFHIVGTKRYSYAL